MRKHLKDHERKKIKLCPHCSFACVEENQLYIHLKNKHFVHRMFLYANKNSISKRSENCKAVKHFALFQCKLSC